MSDKKQLSFDDIDWFIPIKITQGYTAPSIYINDILGSWGNPLWNSNAPIIFSSGGYYLATEPVKYITLDFVVSGVNKYGKNTKD